MTRIRRIHVFEFECYGKCARDKFVPSPRYSSLDTCEFDDPLPSSYRVGKYRPFIRVRKHVASQTQGMYVELTFHCVAEVVVGIKIR